MSNQIDPAEYTGKTRAQRIRLDYHKHRGSVYYWRWLASVAAIAIAAAYLGWVGFSPGGKTHLSTGPISTAHMSIEQNCSACHVDFVPIAADAWQIDPSAAVKSTATKCQACHQSVGAHAPSLNDIGNLADQRCALCHDEHLGRDNQLIPTSNQTCVACHERTSDFCVPQPDSQTPINVSEFSLTNHSDFASLQRLDLVDANVPSIEFDHALHMNPGQVKPGQRGGMRLDRLPKEFLDRYQKTGQSPDSAVKLVCTDCHQFQSSSMGLQRSGEYAWGRNSSPVTYRQHCVACHPLTIPGQRAGQWSVPHGIPLNSLRDSIAGQLAANDMTTETPAKLWKSDDFPIRVPGDASSLAGSRHSSNDQSRKQEMRVQRTELALTRVAQQCRVCHINTDVETSASSPRIPQPRLRAGRFDHSAHRGVTCIACHPQADPSAQSISNPERLALRSWLSETLGISQPATTDGAATEPAPVLLGTLDSEHLKMTLGIASCTPCHRASEQSGSSTNQYYRVLFGDLSDHAPDRCTTCHDYHSDRSSSQKLESVQTSVSQAESGGDRRETDGLSLITTESIPPPITSNLSDSVSSVGRWIGSDSCGTSTCHSGPIGSQPDWNSSQSVFEAFDPHARAGLTLTSKLTEQIVWTLDPASKRSPAHFQQVLRARCNSCHSPIDAQGVMLGDFASSRSERTGNTGNEPDQHQSFSGVSCEACHGPASQWVQSHLRDDWTVSDSMRQTRDFVQRVDGCVRCHVGSRRADGMVRDMNHDMIAAGHPALRFDGWSALRRLPRHAVEDQAKDGLPSVENETQLRRFLAAQAIGIRAAIQLTAERRVDAQPTSTDARSAASVWPELADFDCFACHHHLKITNFAARPSYGHPLPHPSLVAEFIEHGLKYLGPSDVDAMTVALDTIRLRAAGVSQVKPAAFQIEEIIGRYLSRLADPRPLPAGMKSFSGFHDPASTPPSVHSSIAGAWYQASHWYLRSHALTRDRKISGDRREVAAYLSEMADTIQFRRAQGQDGDWTVDSPESFDMAKFRELTKRLSVSVESN
jgi:nitrate/TMAO reductase-like tetraheme cytochrome c subunit